MDVTQEWQLAGKGTAIWQGEVAEGEVAEIKTADDVLDVMEREDPNVIVLMHTAGAMMLSPIFADLAGIICTTGSVGAHVAIMSREFGVPCIVATDLGDSEIHGRSVRLTPAGEVLVRDDG
jgi:phosphohistidine swiveling domain-containing protein